MKYTFLLASLLGFLLLAGCSTTRVVLVPDPDGKVGKIEVVTRGESQVLDQAGESVTVGSLLPPAEPTILSQEEIDSRFGSTLQNEPAPPTTYILQFRHDSTELTTASAGELPAAVGLINRRNSCYIVVAGHTDAVGDKAYNTELSLRRANKVRGLLIEQGVEARCIETLSYGENDPLIPTADNVAEPRNRRVELVVR